MLLQKGFCTVVCITFTVKRGLLFVDRAGHRGAGDPVRNAVSLFAQLFIVGHAFKGIAQCLCAFGCGALRPYGRTIA